MRTAGFEGVRKIELDMDPLEKEKLFLEIYHLDVSLNGGTPKTP